MITTQVVIINLGSGDLHNGFPKVSAQLWAEDNGFPEQFIGSLPAAPHLIKLYRNWQAIYQYLCDRIICPPNRLLMRLSTQTRHACTEEEELEIDGGGITNISVVGFHDLCQKLHQGVNSWLNSAEFLNIDRQLRSSLDPDSEIRVIIETNDDLLRRLPWHCWDFFKDHPKAEMAISRPEYKRPCKSYQPKISRQKARILAVLGNSQGIDLKKETNLLTSLQDAEVVFLVNPTRAQLNEQLWHPSGWDILFFAGHSHSEGATGRIYINENQNFNSLTIEQLEEALKAAIKNGLKLAIFNSCDGLGLANALSRLNIPQVIVMREPVPNRVAQDFFHHFIQAFAVERMSLYLAVSQARQKLRGLEDDFPGASWLPVICQNPAVEPPTWAQLVKIPLPSLKREAVAALALG